MAAVWELFSTGGGCDGGEAMGREGRELYWGFFFFLNSSGPPLWAEAAAPGCGCAHNAWAAGAAGEGMAVAQSIGDCINYDFD